MKTPISMKTSSRVLKCGASLLMAIVGFTAGWAQSGAQTEVWAFDDDSNPASGNAGPAMITIGTAGTGWREAMTGLPGAAGMWDLGKGGQLRVALSHALVGPAQITVRVNHWYDGFIYDTPPISVPNATRVSAAAAMAQVPGSIGYWRTVASVWSVPSGSSVNEVFVESPFSGVIDSVSLSLPVVAAVPLELSIRTLGDGSIEVSWAVAAGMAQLQSSGDIGDTTGWNPVEDVIPQVVGDRYVVTLAPEQSSTFFRLEQ